MSARSAFNHQIDSYIVERRNLGELCSTITRSVLSTFNKQFTTRQIENHLDWLRRTRRFNIKYYGKIKFASSGKITIRQKLEEYASELRHKWPRKPVVLCLPGHNGIDLPIYRRFNAKIHAVERDHETAKFLHRNNKDVIVHECDLRDLTIDDRVNFAFVDFCGYLAKDNLAGLKQVVNLLEPNSLLAVTFVATRWHKKYQRLSSKFGTFRKPYEASAHILVDILPNGYGLYDVRKFVYWANRGFTMATVMGTFDRVLFNSNLGRGLEGAWIKV